MFKNLINFVKGLFGVSQVSAPPVDNTLEKIEQLVAQVQAHKDDIENIKNIVTELQTIKQDLTDKKYVKLVEDSISEIQKIKKVTKK